MHTQTAATVRTAILAAALAFLAGPAATSPAKDDPAKCCFTNQRYSGVCEVEPATGESCGTVLAYLNDPNATGKTYCQSTEVRGGWELSACKAPDASPSPGEAAQRR